MDNKKETIGSGALDMSDLSLEERTDLVMKHIESKREELGVMSNVDVIVIGALSGLTMSSHSLHKLLKSDFPIIIVESQMQKMELEKMGIDELCKSVHRVMTLDSHELYDPSLHYEFAKEETNVPSHPFQKFMGKPSWRK